jgi:hypothetical protein
MARNRTRSDSEKLRDKHILVVEDHLFVGD